MVALHQLSGVQAAEPPSAYGNVKVCRNTEVMRRVLGDSLYDQLFADASNALFPELPEAAILYPALSFNTAERACVSFYTAENIGKMADDPFDVQSWKKKLPEDGGYMFRQTATLMKWT